MVDKQVAGKRLLVLGGTCASLDLVKIAKEMGAYTLVTDDGIDRVAKKIADESAMISTTDLEGLAALVKEKRLDGAFCGPSEFNLCNLIRLCEMTGLPCYTTMNLWERGANKDEFKQYCREYGVDCPEQYFVTEESGDEELAAIDYPAIVKPVDGCSSKGISVCMDQTTIRAAMHYAMGFSKCKRIVVEKYIDNGGELFGARYIVRDGEAYPYLLIDTYVADPIGRKSLISAFTYTPSKRAGYYMATMDEAVRRMIKGMGIKNGTVFFQALPYNGKIYFHEMGYRLSGGFIFKLTEPLMGVNDMKMMIRYALGGEMCTEEEREKLDVSCGGRCGAQLMIPLRAGTVGSVDGLEQLLEMPCVGDFIQYYQVGDRVEEHSVGTLGQLFGRFTLVADDRQEIVQAVERIQKELVVRDDRGEAMTVLSFDLARAGDTV